MAVGAAQLWLRQWWCFGWLQRSNSYVSGHPSHIHLSTFQHVTWSQQRGGRRTMANSQGVEVVECSRSFLFNLWCYLFPVLLGQGQGQKNSPHGTCLIGLDWPGDSIYPVNLALMSTSCWHHLCALPTQWNFILPIRVTRMAFILPMADLEGNVFIVSEQM